MPVLNPDCSAGAETVTLASLRARVLRRLGYAAQVANPPPGMAELVDDFLSSAQTQVYLRYPELATERFFTWTMVVGDRFYGVGANDEQGTCTKVLEPKKLSWVGVEDLNGSFHPMAEGIDPVRYVLADETGLPNSYEIRQEIEVFPAPDQAYKLTVKGHFGLLPFAADADVATIDPELIFLLGLANAKAHYQQPDAGNYFNQATDYLGQLTAGAHGTARYVPGTRRSAPETKPVFLPLLP